MTTSNIHSNKVYGATMQQIELLLHKSTEIGGFGNLSKEEIDELAQLSIKAEAFEDSIPMMPIVAPATLPEMIRFKMFERNIRQKQLAQLLGISEAYISGLLSGKRKLTFELAQKLHKQLGIEAEFILNLV